jgi:hypothetical protein
MRAGKGVGQATFGMPAQQVRAQQLDARRRMDMHRLPSAWTERAWTLLFRMRGLVRDERGDLSSYLAQGILALAALSLTGVVLFSFSEVGQKLKDIVQTWINQPISTGS